MMRKRLLNVCIMALTCMMSMSAWALEKSGNAYQIGSAEDLRAFAELVNGGETLANAVLTADVKCATDQPMIGVDGKWYCGLFDGQGHTITLNAYPQTDSCAVFQRIGYQGWVRNLVVDGQITTAGRYCAGISAYNSGTISNCVSKVVINTVYSGDNTSSGICAIADQGAVMVNCLSAARIVGETATNCAGLVGWMSGRGVMENNLSITEIEIAPDPGNTRSIARNADVQGPGRNLYLTREQDTSDAEGIQITAEDLKNGTVCFYLNSDQSDIQWTQTLGEDDYPVPFKTRSQVYAKSALPCSGGFVEGTEFTNNASEAVACAKHNMVVGLCQNEGCGLWDPFFVDRDDEGWRVLKTAEDMDWFRQSHTFGNEHGYVRLAADIDYTSRPEFLNTSNWFWGDFDGQGHTIEIAFPDKYDEEAGISGENNALFPRLAGRISNLKVTGTIESSAKFAAGLVGHTQGGGDVKSVLRNIVTDVKITSTIGGDGTHGGLIAVTDGEVYIYNSIALGDIVSPEHVTSNCGGLIGWTNNTSNLFNCAFLGVLDVGENDTDVITRHNGSSNITNTYYVNYSEGMLIPASAKQVSANAVSSGELTFLLNGDQSTISFWQTLGTDAAPVPFEGKSQQVYAAPSGGFQCDGTPLGNVTYTNSESATNIPPHTFNGGAFCEVCGFFNEEFIKPNADGYYELASGKDLVWFSQMVNNGSGNLNAKLTADIQMEDEDNERFQPIGTTAVLYTGTFDGQLHTISNLVIDRPDQYTGMFGCVGGGVVIENFVLDNTCSISGGAFTGLVGGSNGSGEVRFLQLGNEGTVTSSAQNAGGIYGCNMSSAAKPIIENCYVTGKVKGANESGQISGWAASGQVRNTWSIAELEGVDGSNYMFRGSPTSENNYSSLGQGSSISEEDLASGALTWKLNKEKFSNVTWYQTLDEDLHPLLNPTHGIVYKFGNELGCVIGGDISALRSAMVSAETEWIQDPDMYAQTALKEAYEEQIEGLSEANDLESLMTLYNALTEAKNEIKACTDAYNKYKAKVDETLRYMDEHDDFSGPDRDFLQDYLESGDEPNEDNPNGGAEYILEYQLLTTEEITAETARIDELLRVAVANGYEPGTEVTSFILNADFRDSFNNWEGQKGSGAAAYQLGDEGLTYYGAESWSKSPMDMYQTVTLPKKGYYLYMMNAAYRPANDRYSYSHAAKIYANGVSVVLPTVMESYVPYAEAIDQVNANLHSGDVEDLPILADPTDEENSDTLGFALHGQRSMAIAVMSNRVVNHTVAEVGEDGQLTVGISNPHGYHTTSEEWTGFANARLVFLGEDLEAAEAQSGLDASLQDDVDRATTILTLYQFSDDTDFNHAPNYSNALKAELQTLVDESGKNLSGAEKFELLKKFSDIFDRIYDCRMAYSAMFAKAEALAGVAYDMASVLGEDLSKAMGDAALDAMDAYSAGNYSAEQARNAMNDFDVMPDIIDGVYQIANGIHLSIYAANVNGGEASASAVLIDDIDVGGKLLEDGTPDTENGSVFTPIGTPNYIFTGTFDGQGHKISNLVVETGTDVSGAVGGVNGGYAGLFGVVGGGATVKNLVLDNTCYIHGAAFTGLIGGSSGSGTITMEQLGNEGTVLADNQNAGGIIGCNMNSSAAFVITNCYVTGPVKGGRESGAISGWMGGSQSSITNCWSTAEVSGNDDAKPFYRNDDTKVTNSYNQYGQQATSISDNDVKSGKLTYLLNEGETDNPVWFQNLSEGGDAHPVLFGSDIVYLFQNKYTNEKPTIELNSYAYAIETASSADNVTVTYALNANAKAAKINFKKGDEVVYTQELAGDELTLGKHSVTVANSNLPEAGTTLTYDIEVTSFGVAEAYRVKAPTETGNYKVFNVRSLAYNNNTESPAFGTLYVAEADSNHGNETGYISDEKKAGIFAFDAEFNQIDAADGTPGFQGGLTLEGDAIKVYDGENIYDPKSVTFSADGRLFIGRMGGRSNSPVWEANPEDLNEAWTPLFTGGETDAETGITWIGEDIQAGMMSDITTSGAGNSLKLWTLACGRSTGEALVTDYFGYTYDLGTKKQWDTTPSGQVDQLMNQWTIAPAGVQIAADNQGGLWYVQYRDNPSEEVPAMKHINAEGKVDYSNVTSKLTGAGLAVSPDGSYIAVASGNGKVTIYSVSYAPNEVGLIMPAPKFTISTQEANRINALAFDYAGNLYATSRDSRTLNRYVLPSWSNNVTVTPAPAAAAFQVGATAIQNIAEGNANGEIYTIGGVRVQKAQKGVNIINGNKVLVK